MDREVFEHPSYAMLSVCKVTHGGNKALYGSSIKHSNTIRLSIRGSKMERSLGRDWFYGSGKDHIEVEMSYSQFAEAITSMNCGDGVPVTLRYLNGGQIEDCPFIDKRQQFERELNADIQGGAESIDRTITSIADLFNSKKSFSKADKDSVLNMLANIQRSYKDRVPFLYSSFNEQMDKTVLEAKGEVESFIQNKISGIAMNALQNNLNESLKLENSIEIASISATEYLRELDNEPT